MIKESADDSGSCSSKSQTREARHCQQEKMYEVKGMPRKENFLIYFELVLKIRTNQN